MTSGLPPVHPLPPGRIAAWRARAERAYANYQDRARRQPVLGLPLAFFARYTARQGMLLASAAAFRLFLWLVPLALVVAGVLAAIEPSESSSVESVSRNAGLTGVASQQVTDALRGGNHSWWVAVVTGSVLFLWATRTLIRNLVVVNAHAWGAPLPKSHPKEVMRLTLIFAGAWILVFAFGVMIHWLEEKVTGGLVLGVIVEGSTVAALWLAVTLRLPDLRRDWRDLIPGALILGFGLALMNTLGRVYLPPRFAHSSKMYGSLGIASVMLAWLLLVGELIVSSLLANVVWSDYREGRRTLSA